MLKTRILTALVIFSLTLVALFLFSDFAWAVFTLVIVGAALWEWGRFCQFSKGGARIFWTLSFLHCGLIFFAYQTGQLFGITFRSFALAGFAVATLFWLLAVPVWLLNVWRPTRRWVTALAGWVTIFPTWMALLFLRDISPWLLLTFAAIVWVADITAYFVGKRFGKNKLALAISPGKTIEGALGGIVGVAAYFFIWQELLANSFVGRQTWSQDLRVNLIVLIVFFVVLAVLSIVGDLFESWMKRGAGMKDSSNLLPGHGGVLDRIDALTSTLPVAGLYVLLRAGS